MVIHWLFPCCSGVRTTPGLWSFCRFQMFLASPHLAQKKSCRTPKYVGKNHVGVFQLFPLKHLEANDSDSIFTRYVKIGCAEDSPTTSWDITAAPWSSNGSNWPPISGGSGRLPLQRYNRMLKTIDRHPFTIWRKTGMFLTFFNHVIVVIVSGWCQLMPPCRWVEPPISSILATCAIGGTCHIPIHGIRGVCIVCAWWDPQSFRKETFLVNIPCFIHSK